MNWPLLRPSDPILSSRSSSTVLVCWYDPCDCELAGRFRPNEPDPPSDDPPPLVEEDFTRLSDLGRGTASADPFTS